mmetsp:Transcript_16443/g.38055  ORF Transcript_16443/g.38055 Transcript_16443/m.38055 type:complete len:86 (-) Transcript_16443:411-668(-)
MNLTFNAFRMMIAQENYFVTNKRSVTLNAQLIVNARRSLKSVGMKSAALCSAKAIALDMAVSLLEGANIGPLVLTSRVVHQVTIF